MQTHGCTWCYDSNDKKSGVLAIGETPFANKPNAENRIFKPGQLRVAEHIEYDHVGIKAYIFQNNVSGNEERLIKCKRSVNAVSGLGFY